MKLKEAATLIFSEINDVPVRQCEIVKKVMELTGYSYDSCIGNLFRQVDYLPFITKEFKKIKINNGVYYVRGENEYNQDYNKPPEYFELLSELNTSDKVYTLCGTESNCSNSIDPNKLIKVDKSPLTNPDIRGDIFEMELNGNNVNLDFEGYLTPNKVDRINKLDSDKILLTIKKSKKMKSYLDELSYNISKSFEYKSKSGRSNMCIFLLNKKTYPN